MSDTGDINYRKLCERWRVRALDAEAKLADARRSALEEAAALFAVDPGYKLNDSTDMNARMRDRVVGLIRNLIAEKKAGA